MYTYPPTSVPKTPKSSYLIFFFFLHTKLNLDSFFFFSVVRFGTQTL